MTSKQIQRQEMLARRDAKPQEYRLEHSRRIHKLLRKQDFYKNASCVYCYVSFRSEVDTRELLQTILNDRKKLFVPRVTAKVPERDMQFYEITSLDNLLPGSFGIPEPDPENCLLCKTRPSGLMILPGAAFDRSGRRLGYGGGYYDRYLFRHPDFYKAALAFECQLCSELSQEETDIRMDIVITESCVYRCGKS